MWRFHRLREESGQSLVLAAAAMVVILGMAAMAIDVGMFLQERRDLQNAADAAALAGRRTCRARRQMLLPTRRRGPGRTALGRASWRA